MWIQRSQGFRRQLKPQRVFIFIFYLTLTFLNAVTFSMVPKCPTEKLWSASTELSQADVMSILDCGCMGWDCIYYMCGQYNEAILSPPLSLHKEMATFGWCGTEKPASFTSCHLFVWIGFPSVLFNILTLASLLATECKSASHLYFLPSCSSST